MGVVFAARHEALDQLVAIKVLLADAIKGEGVIERFVREAQAAARLQSEHVARVFDAGSLDNEIPFLVMEYLEGCDLEELLQIGGGAAAIPDACDYILQALGAMAQAHAVGIVHRDLKPANLYLAVRPDGSNIIKILDFGISKQTAATRREKALTGRAVLGSPAYMPPEQLRNAKSVDMRADIWSLGIVLYELLTGTVPFDGEGVGEIFAAILEKDPPSIIERQPEVSPELEAVVMKALQRKPEDRYQDVAEFAHALAPFGSGRWNALLETIDSTLARSQQLRAMQTPAEVRVPSSEKIRLLAQMKPNEAKAITPNDKTIDEKTIDSPFQRNSAELQLPSNIAADSAPPVSTEAPRRGRAWALMAVMAAAVIGGAAFMARGYLVPHLARPAVMPAAADEPAAPPAEAPKPAHMAKDDQSSAAEPPKASDSPSDVAAPAAHAAQPREPQAREPDTTKPSRAIRRPTRSTPAPSSPNNRPKFLNSRE